jgi:hypothetical protein
MKRKREKLVCLNDGCFKHSKRNTCKDLSFSRVCNTRIAQRGPTWPHTYR